MSEGGYLLGRIAPRPLSALSHQLQGLVRGRLWLQVLVGMVAGIAVGVAIGPSTGWVAPRTAAVIAGWLAFPGQLFLALVQMIVIPLVVASIVRGLAASENVDQLRRMGARVVLFFVLTTALAVVIGIAAALLVEPGRFVESQALAAGGAEGAKAAAAAPALTLADIPARLITVLPTNPLNAMVHSEMLGIVVFSVIVGIALVMMAPDQAKPLLDLLGSLQQVCMTVVRWAMWLAPYAVFGLMAQLAARIGLNALLGMAVYVATVIGGLAVLLLVHLAIVVLIARRSPLAYLADVREVLLLAFSTSSSAAVMPLSMKTAEEKLRVRPSIAQFVIPIGATINMGGTALYQGAAAVFLAQVYGVEIGVDGLALVVLTAVGASIGTPATPGVGIVILAMVLATVNVPASGIALIMGVDRILDMCRTAINVNGDLTASVVMDRWVGGPLSYREEARAAERYERLRRDTGADSILTGEDA